MSKQALRSLYKILAMISGFTFGIASGCFDFCIWGFFIIWLFCGSGHKVHTTRTTRIENQTGMIANWHDIASTKGTLNAKDLNFARQWLGGNQVVLALQVPTAPGASQPGVLRTEETSNNLNLWINGNRNEFKLVSDDTIAGELGAILPSTSGAHWQVLAFDSMDWVSQIPTETVEADISGSLKYEIDFLGESYCPGCEIKMAICSDYQFDFREQLALKLSKAEIVQGEGVWTCTEPMSTYVTIYDYISGELMPGELIASFGPWGGLIYTNTLSADMQIPYWLSHSGAMTETFTLEAIQSDRGWSYTWQDPDGSPISQIEVPPDNFYNHDPFMNVLGTGLPTCTRTSDTIHLTATSITTPSLQAKTTTIIRVLPDPAVCPIADVGIVQVASTEVISAGNWVTYTLTISNFEASPVDVVVTSTLSSEGAIAETKLPGGCVRQGAETVCQVSDVPGEGTTALELSIKISETSPEWVGHKAQVEPIGASDDLPYDNITPPLYVRVTGSVVEYKVYLPYLSMNP